MTSTVLNSIGRMALAGWTSSELFEGLGLLHELLPLHWVFVSIDAGA